MRKRVRRALRAMALAFAVAAVVTGTAAGKFGGREAPQSGSELPYLSHGELPEVLQWDVPGGVTPLDLARAYESRSEVVAATSDGFDRDDVAIGFGLGLILAAACAAALVAARGRMRVAHS